MFASLAGQPLSLQNQQADQSPSSGDSCLGTMLQNLLNAGDFPDFESFDATCDSPQMHSSVDNPFEPTPIAEARNAILELDQEWVVSTLRDHPFEGNHSNNTPAAFAA